jgi:hypothetical protein
LFFIIRVRMGKTGNTPIYFVILVTIFHYSKDVMFVNIKTTFKKSCWSGLVLTHFVGICGHGNK